MDGLMKGKRGLIMGIANRNSIAYGIARTLAAHGAEMAVTYQGEAFGKRVKPLAEELGVDVLLDCDVEKIETVDAVFETLREKWGTIDFVVHAIGFSDKSELKGLYADTTRDNFSRTMVISCFSFTEVTKRAAALMPDGGSILTLTYAGSVRVMPNYNVMGVAKAALEASVRYLAADYGQDGYPRQCHIGRPGPYPRRRGHRRCPDDVQPPGQERPIAADRDPRRTRRIGSLSVVGTLGRRDRRNPLCRQRLQHHFDAATGGSQEGGRARRRIGRLRSQILGFVYRLF